MLVLAVCPACESKLTTMVLSSDLNEARPGKT
jgi:hypothetical protein